MLPLENVPNGQVPVILATWKAEIRRITYRGQVGQIISETPISKITKAKWTGDVAQVVIVPD
jgi:hypothetical protein